MATQSSRTFIPISDPALQVFEPTVIQPPQGFGTANVTVVEQDQRSYTEYKVTNVTNNPGGNIEEVQFNNGTSFAGDSGLTYDAATDSLTVTGVVFAGEVWSDTLNYANGNPWTGVAGTSGYSGINGATGTSGYSGSNGLAGDPGTSGYSGSNGLAGDPGTSGYSGWSGIDGLQGDPGDPGLPGDPGTSGYSGWSGIDGLPGDPGDPGTSGYSGFSGIWVNTVTTLETLGSASTHQGMRAMITNGNLVATGNFGAVITDGGANIVPIYSDGTDWLVG
jgi:hypothetical protein